MITVAFLRTWHDGSMENTGLSEPVEEAIMAFWAISRESVGMTRIENLVGPQQRAALRPPAVHLSEDPAEATDLAVKIAEGELTELVSEEEHFDELPRVGDLMIVCDGEGIPRSLVQTTEVSTHDKLVTERLVSLYPKQLRKKK